jgi:hypothetical protein
VASAVALFASYTTPLATCRVGAGSGVHTQGGGKVTKEGTHEGKREGVGGGGPGAHEG